MAVGLVNLWALLLLSHALAEKQSFDSPEDLLKRTCFAQDDKEVSVSCRLPPGQWLMQSSTPFAHVMSPLTTLNGDWEDAPAGDFEGPSLSFPPNASEPLVVLGPNTTFTLSNIQLIGARFSSILTTQLGSSLLNLTAFRLFGSSRLRLVNVSIVTPDCSALIQRQGIACALSPSPNFTVGPGTLTILSYSNMFSSSPSSPSWQALNVTLRCSGSDLRPLNPPCLAKVVSSSRQLLSALQVEAMSMSGNLSVYITRSMSLLDTAPDDDPASSSTNSSGGDGDGKLKGGSGGGGTLTLPPTASSAPQKRTQSLLVLRQPLLILCGHPDGSTRLDLSDTTGLVRMPPGTRILLQDLTLAGLPPGPSHEYPLALLRAAVWTFDLPRRLLGSTERNRLALVRVRLELSPIEVALWAQDAMAPDKPMPPPPPASVAPGVPLCAVRNGFFDQGKGNASWVPLPGSASGGGGGQSAAALLIRRVLTMSSQMSLTLVLFVPSVAEPPPDAGADWRRHPLCQLLPEQPADRPPRFSVEVEFVSEVDVWIWPYAIMPAPGSTEPYVKILSGDARLATGPRLLFEPSFSEMQSQVPCTCVLLGDPFRPRRLDLAMLPAAINLRLPDGAMTLRSMVLVGLAPAGLHPRAKAPQPPSSPQPPPEVAVPLLAVPLPGPHKEAPAGSDPTGGLPPGLANLTSCLWALDFDRAAAWSVGGLAGEYESVYGSPGGSSLQRVFLDSVVLVVPPAEAALLAWVWASNDTSDLTDPQVAQHLREALQLSSLTGGEAARHRLASSVQEAVAATATAAADGGGYTFAGRLVFARLRWCGLEGRNVTITACKPAAKAGAGATGGSNATGAITTAALQLPIAYPFNRAAALGNSSPPPGALRHPPNGSQAESETRACCRGDTSRAVVPLVYGVVGGLVGTLLLGAAAAMLVRRQRRRQERWYGGGFVNGDKPAAAAGRAAAAGKAGPEANAAAPAGVSQVPARTPPEDVRQCEVAVSLADPCAAGPWLGFPQPLSSSAMESPAVGGLGSVGVVAGAGSVSRSLVSCGAGDSDGGTHAAGNGAGTSKTSSIPVATLKQGSGGSDSLADGAGFGSVIAVSLLTTGQDDPAAGSGAMQLGQSSSSLAMELPGKGDTSLELALKMPPESTVSASVTADFKPSLASSAVPAGAATAAATIAAAAVGDASDGSLAKLEQQQEQQRQVRELALALHVRLAKLRDDLAGSVVGGVPTGVATPMSSLDQHRGPHSTTSSHAWSAVANTVAAATAAAARTPADNSLSDGADMGTQAGELFTLAAAANADGCHGAVSGAVSGAAGGGGVLDALTLTGELGRGAQGVVYRGVWKGLQVAVKCLLLHRKTTSGERVGGGGWGGGGSAGGMGLSPDAVTTANTTPVAAATTPQELAQQRALREAAISIRVSQHSNVVATYHADACSLRGGDCWKITLIMQLCDGGSLQRALDIGLLAPSTSHCQSGLQFPACPSPAGAGATPVLRPLQPRTLLLVVRDVAAGLAQLHSVNIVHGDVSSSNVLLVSDQSPYGSGSSSYARMASSSGTTVTITSSSGTMSMSLPYDKLSGEGGGGGSSGCETWVSDDSAAFAALLDTSYCSGEGTQRRTRHPVLVSARPSDRPVRLGSYGYVAKLGDFGLSEVLPPGSDHVRTQNRRSSAYTAPETARGGRVGPPSDVYSWGVLCWEVALGASLPRALISPAGAAVRTWLAAADWVLADCGLGPGAGHGTEAGEQPGQPGAWRKVDEEAGKRGDGGALPSGLLTWPPHVPPALVLLVGECLAAEPAARPSARSLVQRLEHIIAGL